MLASERTIQLPLAEKILPHSRLRSIAYLGNAALTLFITPPHKTLHKDVESSALESQAVQPLQPPIPETKINIEYLLANRDTTNRTTQLDSAQMLYLFGTLIQFSDHISSDEITYPFERIQALKDSFVEEAKQTGPLAFDWQLAIALDHNDDDLFESLWQLFMTSRTYARWLDSAILPHDDMTDEQKKKEMTEWRHAIAACKLPVDDSPQDPAGDAYYTWTHALAQAAITTHPYGTRTLGRIASRTFENGTNIMHSLVHSLNKQSVPNSHHAAAQYGNAIGAILAKSMRRPS